MAQGNASIGIFFEEESLYDLVKLPNGKRTLKDNWVFRLKQEDNGAKSRYSAILVVKGFNQRK